MGGILGRRTVRAGISSAVLAVVMLTSTAVGWATDSTSDVDGETGVTVRKDLRRRLFRMTNNARERHDRREVAFARRVSRYATRHSVRMARRGYIFHSTDAQLRDALRGTGWRARGENVGVATSVKAVQRAFMDSAPHRENILRRAFDHAAVGVVRHDGRVWTTVIFYGR